MRDHGEVVRDEQIGQAELAPQPRQQIDDLRLHRNVQRGHRLVAHHEVRLQHQRAGDADALALAAGELVRIAAQVRGAEADPFQRRDNAGARVRRAAAARAAAAAGRRSAPTLRRGFERGVGVLENDLHARAQRRQRARVERRRDRRRRSAPCPPSARAAAAPARPSVVLPQPLSPIRPRRSPRAMVRSTPSTARTTSPAPARGGALRRARKAAISRAHRTAPARHAVPSAGRRHPRAAAPIMPPPRDAARRAPAPGAHDLRLLAALVRARTARRRNGSPAAACVGSGTLAGDRRQGCVQPISRGSAGQQPGGVGMARGRNRPRARRPGLHHLAGIHHRDPVAMLRDHAEIVGDQHQRTCHSRAQRRPAAPAPAPGR